MDSSGKQLYVGDSFGVMNLMLYISTVMPCRFLIFFRISRSSTCMMAAQYLNSLHIPVL